MIESTPSAAAEIEAFVERFEEALRTLADRDLNHYLPDRDHPLYDNILAELMRTDLEYGWGTGAPRTLADYRNQFADFFADPAKVCGVAFEEYRLRRQAGENPSPQQYANEFGIQNAGWPRPFPEKKVFPNAFPEDVPTSPVLLEAARAYQSLSRKHSSAEASRRLDQWCATSAGNASVQFFRDLHQQAPQLARTMAEGLTTMPEVGDTFLDFFLVAELGRGAFGRVFLARQQALANRLVALKIAPDSGVESQTLAQLQHTHIVPIYSTHQAGALQAVCMPFFGRLTLADITRNLRNRASLPQTGVALLTTLHQQQTREAIGHQSAPTSTQPHPTVPRHREDAARSILKRLQGWSYVEAVLWLGSCLAEGLAHAHDRGIHHRDLKPANVLITDEGVPMLLDFNLAEDTKVREMAAAAAVGGTLPYMAPEQIDAFRGRPRRVDDRSDIFAVGIILFELLTGRSPWDHLKEARPAPATVPANGSGKETLEETIERLYQQRLKPAASVRRYNKHATPAAASIIQHCLEADPARRYQTAQQLHEDLQRQLDAQPLKYAREPSLRERVKKRLRRSPRLIGRLLLGVAGCLLLAALWFGLRAEHLQQQQEAADNYEQFQRELQPLQFALNIRDEENILRNGIDQCYKTLQRYQVLSDADWRQRPAFALLAPEQQERVDKHVGDLLMSLVMAELRARAGTDAPFTSAEFDRLLRCNDEAGRCVAGSGPSPVVWHQRADLYERHKDTTRAGELRAEADALPLTTAQDHKIRGQQLIGQGQVKKALPLLQNAARLDPQYYWANFLLGTCWDEAGNDSEAAASYTVCIAIDPDFFGAYFNRGLAYQRQRIYAKAVGDFTKVIDLQPDLPQALPKAYINRALAWNGQKQYQKAIADLTHALAHKSETRVYFIRADAKKKLGDEAGFKLDLESGIAQQPADALSWLARGKAHAEHFGKPDAALKDFDAALKLNPTSRAAWKNKAWVFDAFLNQPHDSIACLDQVIKLYPDHAPAYAGRGVLLARLGKRDQALKDAHDTLALDHRPDMLYQVGCIFALTSRAHPQDRGPALKLLADALRGGFGLKLLATDKDLDPLRHLPEFKKLQDAAKALNF